MPDIIHFFQIKSPAEKVYKAITTKEGIDGWWTEENTADSKVGSIIEFNFGEQYQNRMKVLTLVENKLVEWECLEGDLEWVGTKYKFEIMEEEQSCWIRFSHTDWDEQTDFYGMCNYHWGLYMKSLKSFCEAGKGTPFLKT